MLIIPVFTQTDPRDYFDPVPKHYDTVFSEKKNPETIFFKLLDPIYPMKIYYGIISKFVLSLANLSQR